MTKGFFSTVAVIAASTFSVPAVAGTTTFNVSGTVNGNKYVAVTVNTDESWIKYHWEDGSTSTLAVPQDQIWGYHIYFAGQDPRNAGGD